ncbi:5294_t:CDS:2 [Funneliformis caledonium]|uniref:5294_t:CDS:1 n=1 Tax=Funneliformis caledonium TaxID=1117310 RepID=A0A9N9E734_9GLOM|nr:5294_t:CDS:2 [Funneliformis caledonium]
MVENPVEINEKLVEEWPIQIAKFGQKLIASEVHYYIEYQEYPNISETSFASVYNVSGWDEDEAQKAFSMTNIQYSYGGNGTTQLNISHTSVDFTSSLFKNMFNANEKFYEKATLCMFDKAHEYKCGYVDQNGIKCDGEPKLGELTQVVGSIVSKKKFIGCTKWQSREINHLYLTIPNNVDLELLEMMFNNHSYYSYGIDFERDESDVIDKCFTICPNNT